SAEEFVAGYDAKLVGRGFFKELYLQFKAPTYSEHHNRFTIRPTAHQHRLLKEYPPHSAFYVAGMFRSLHELNTHQTHLQRAADFLVNFVCIDVSGLPDAIDFFHFSRPPTNRQSPNIAFKVSADGSTRTATHPVIGRGWLRGSTLLEQFRTGTLGANVQLGRVDEYELSSTKSTDYGEYIVPLFPAKSMDYLTRQHTIEDTPEDTPTSEGQFEDEVIRSRGILAEPVWQPSQSRL